VCPLCDDNLKGRGDSDGALVVPIELESGIALPEACSPHLRRDGKRRSLAGADPAGRDELERLIDRIRLALTVGSDLAPQPCRLVPCRSASSQNFSESAKSPGRAWLGARDRARLPPHRPPKRHHCAPVHPTIPDFADVPANFDNIVIHYDKVAIQLPALTPFLPAKYRRAASSTSTPYPARMSGRHRA
jgi:hypothetical protein